MTKNRIFKDIIQDQDNQVEAKYLLGVCYLGQNNYSDSLKFFTSLIENNPMYRKNIYLLSSIAYKKLNQIEQAFDILDKAINNFPDYYDAYIFRGKLFIKEKQYNKALMDFQDAIAINPNKGLGYMNLGDCQKSVGKYDEAFQSYNQLLKFDEFNETIVLLKRAICQIESKQNLQQGIKDINTVLKQDPQNSEALFYKGVVLKQQFQHNEAVLSFEQCIKHNNSKKAVGKSLYEIARINIEKRDFYAALHTLNRSDYLDIEKGLVEKLKIFVEGVIFLMKRKFTEALDNFNSIQTNQNQNSKSKSKKSPSKNQKDLQNDQLGDFLKPLFHQYRAYGYFCQGQHQNALFDYLTVDDIIKKQKKDDCNSIYNKHLCEGILAIDINQYEEAIQLFDKSAKILKNKVEPLFYKGVTLIRMAFEIHKDDEDKKTESIIEGLKELDKAVDVNQNNANLFYYRAVIRCMLGYFNEGIADIDQAIDKSEDNVPKYFYLRGHAFGCCQGYKQAVNDLSICIQLDENFANAYLERAKNYHYVGDSNQAFADLQKYISLKPNDPEIHMWAGNLLFHSGALDDAIKAYSHSDQIDQDLNLLAVRSKCYLQQKNIEIAYLDIQKVVEQCSSRSCKFDSQMMQILLLAIDDQNYTECLKIFDQIAESEIKTGRMFRHMDLVFYQAVINFYAKNYQESIKLFKEALKLKQQHDNEQKIQKLESLSDAKQQQTQALLYDQQFQNNLTDSFSINQCYYNLSICQIMLKNYTAAIQNLESITYIFDDKEDHKKYYNLIQILKKEQQLQNQIPDKNQIKEFEQNYIYEIFPHESMRLCNKFELIDPQFKLTKNLHFQLSFCLPTVEPPSLHPEFDGDLVQSFKVTDVEDKPEAPWIRRSDDGVIFTDNIQIFESLDLQTEQAESTQRENIQLNSDEKLKFDKENELKKLKQDLLLGGDIEQKLNKMIKKNK